MRTFTLANVLCLAVGLCGVPRLARAQFGPPHDPKDDQPAPFKRTSDGKPDLSVTADSETWLRFLRKEAGLPFAVLMRRVRLKGSPRLLLAFGRCFPA